MGIRAMGCSGSDTAAKEDPVKTKEDGAAEKKPADKKPAGGPIEPLIMTVTNVWNEGKTLEEVAAALKKTQEVAMTVDGVLCFQYAIDEANRKNQVTEIYRDASVIGGFFAAMGDPAKDPTCPLAKLGAVTNNPPGSVTACGPKAQVEAAAGALEQFKPALLFSDAAGPGVGAATKAPIEPLIMTVTNVWNEGKTLEEVAAALKKTQEVAMPVDGVLCFQYAIDEANRKNQVT